MKKLVLATVVCSLLPLAAQARPHGERGLKRMDTNGDKKVSQAEFNAGHQKRFARTDKNNNGFIEASEARHPKAKRLLEKADSNNDGKVSQTEFDYINTQRFRDIDANSDGFISHEEGRNAARSKRFDRMDANGDGSISKEEFMNAKRKHKRGRKVAH